MIRKVVSLEKPFVIIQNCSSMGDDWFLLMFETDSRKLSGFYENKDYPLLEEFDLEDKDMTFFFQNRKDFQKKSVGKNLYEFNYKGANFKAVYDAKIAALPEKKMKRERSYA